MRIIKADEVMTPQEGRIRPWPLEPLEKSPAFAGAGREPSQAPAQPDDPAVRDLDWVAGYQDGYEAGLQAARNELREQLRTVYRLAEEAVRAKAEVIASAESEMVELVIEIAQKIIGEVVELNPTIVVHLVANAIEYASTGDVLIIRVNPRDVEVLREYWADALEGGAEDVTGVVGRRRWEIVADRRVKPGGCIIDTRAGTVDAQIDTQLLQIKYAFTQAAQGQGLPGEDGMHETP